MVSRYEVRFSAEAELDLDRIFFYIAEQSSFEIADVYLARLERACLLLRSFPNRGTAIPGSETGLRSTSFDRRVTILFRVANKHVEILRLLYGGRDLDSVLAKF
jgi:toxin ParE1/3/4